VSAETSPKKAGDFDVVLMHGPTDDGSGSKVLRARPGRFEAGEVRPMTDGQPLAPGGEVVRLERRAEASSLFDVHVDFKVPDAKGTDTAASHALSGPAQVATRAYRDSWDRTFGVN
jgi:hypothetical protein